MILVVSFSSWQIEEPKDCLEQSCESNIVFGGGRKFINRESTFPPTFDPKVGGKLVDTFGPFML